jgi:hypothetical protein
MKLTRTIFISIACVFLLPSCSLKTETEKELQSTIYSEVILYSYSYPGDGKFDFCKDEGLIINSLTEDFRTVTNDWETAKSYFPQLEKETWENFLQLNIQQTPFPSDLDLGCKYTLVNIKSDLPEPFTEDCPVVFFFSQIGFNSRKSQALVSHLKSCGWYSCGALYFVELIDGQWSVKDLDYMVCA